MDDFFSPSPTDTFVDFFATPSTKRIGLGRGGARPNSGPKPKEKLAALTPEEAIANPSAYQRYEAARADKEMHLARQAAVKADLDEANVVLRDSVATAAARAFATCSQALDAIGDNLERDGIPIDVCEKVMKHINSAKEQLAIDLEKTYAANAD